MLGFLFYQYLAVKNKYINTSELKKFGLRSGDGWAAIFFVPPTFFAFFATFVGFGKCKNARNGLKLIWHMVLWSIWKSRLSTYLIIMLRRRLR